jgi:glycosyltransferase involved in cell wall biosynthesis
MKTAILHYSAPPEIGGVEAVIQAHAAQFAAAGLPLTVIAGRGDIHALPQGVEFVCIAEIDTMNPEVAAATAELNRGTIPDSFERLVERLTQQLRPHLKPFDHLIVHNVLTKHFNLPLTAALFRLMDEGTITHLMAWCHDLTWSSPNSRNKVFDAFPWNLLKTVHKQVTYVAISQQRKHEIVETFGLPPENIPVINNGVDPATLLNFSQEGAALIDRLNLWTDDLILLMPVRVTTAKNIEYAMQVLAALKTLNNHVRLVLTGPPDPHDSDSMDYYQSLLDLRRRLDLEHEMCFIFESGPLPGSGYLIDQRVVADLYHMADIMFMPSHREGFGMPILEAGLLGLPVFATAVPAIQELAIEKSFVFTLDTSPQQLAEQILNWAKENPEYLLRAKVRQAYTWKAIFERDLLPILKGGPN